MLPAFVQSEFENAHITVVDLEPEVVHMALKHFNVKESPRLEIVLSDGRRWLNNISGQGLPANERYDLVIQDACAGHPCSLVTVEVGTSRVPPETSYDSPHPAWGALFSHARSASEASFLRLFPAGLHFDPGTRAGRRGRRAPKHL